MAAATDEEPRRRRLASPLAVGLVSLVLAVALLAGCAVGEAPPAVPDLALVPRLEPHATGRGRGCLGADGEPIPARPRRIEVAESSRQSVVTCAGRSFRASIELPPGAVLELSLALAEADPAGEAPTPADATVELVANGQSRRLFSAQVQEGDGWTDHRIETGDRAARTAGGTETVELVLESTGPRPVAWSELYLTGNREGEGDAGSGRRPNLVLVSLDTLRADHLDLYGYHRATSPELDRLAADSLVFDHALSTSTWTLPSTASMLSGLLPSQHGATSTATRLSRRVLTLAERLAAAGYRTAAFTDGGFLSPRWGFAQGFGRYDSTEGEAWAKVKDAKVIFSAASEWVRANRFRPFFLFLHTYEIHTPYVDQEGYADPFFEPGYTGPFQKAVQLGVVPLPPDPADLARVVALYDGEIARTDHYLGTFLETLSATGLDRNTAVIVTSDHGEEFLEHGDLAHATGKVFDPNVHVPLIVRPPGGTEGLHVQGTVSGLDVTPTLLALAGLSTDELPGRSLLDAARGGDDRLVFVHGLSAHPEPPRDVYRLDGKGDSVFLEISPERPRGPILTYDPATDRAEPRGDRASASDRKLDRRLAAILAWLGRGRLLARLPDEVRRIEVPEGSRIRPRGVWDGLRWYPVARDGKGLEAIDLRPGRVSFLVFDVAGRRGGLGLRVIRGAGRKAEPFWIHAAHGISNLGWQPFSDVLPRVGVALATASSFQAGQAQIDQRARDELRSLGYVD